LIGILTIIGIVLFSIWYLNPGYGLPNLEEPEIRNPEKIVKGSLLKDPHYMQIHHIQNQVHKIMDEIKKDTEVKSSMMYVDIEEYTLIMGIQEVNFLEKRILKGKVYQAIGKRFNLRIVECCVPKYADVIGVIKDIDVARKRVLIVDDDKKIGNTELPDAAWVSIREDTSIRKRGFIFTNSVTFDQLTVDQSVEAWSSGFMDTSYPGQTEAVKLMISENGQP
jgi:hypothetical protein